MADSDTLLDLRGLKCPLPALKTRKALSRVAAGTIIRVECTDPMAAIDIPHLIGETRDHIEEQSRDGDLLIFRIRKADATGG
jgi:tRNA 2-thiouridine synthesizing protein A